MSDIIYNFGQNANQMNPLTAIGQGLNQVYQIKEAKEQQLQSAREQQAQADELNSAYAFLQSGEATAQDYANLAMKLPKDQSEALRASFTLLSEDEARNTLDQTGKIFSSFKSGRTDIATDLLEDLAKAYENSGEETDAGIMRKWAEIAKTSPEGAAQAENYFGFIMSQIPGGTEVVDSAINLSKSKGDRDLTQARVNEINVKNRVALQGLEAKINAQGGVLNEADKTKETNRIRTEFIGQTKTAREAATKVAKINAVVDRSIANAGKGEQVEGVTDLALVNSFQRLIDDGVVKGEDVKLAMETAGQGSKILNTFNNFTKGSVLTPEQREEFRAVAQLLGQAELDSMESVKKLYRPHVNKLGLDETLIYGESESSLNNIPKGQHVYSGNTTDTRTEAEIQADNIYTEVDY